MVFTIKKPKSQRFLMFSFGGFKPVGRNKFVRYLKTWLSFFGFIGLYLWGKFLFLLSLITKVIKISNQAPRDAKDYVVRKLIWSRGKLGRPIATTIILGVSLLVFFSGEFLSSYKFVVDQPVLADYLVANTDLLPKKEVALTTIPEVRKRTKAETYVIEGGDTLSTIGEKFKVSIDGLKYVNNLTDDSILKVGQELTIPPVSGLIHTVKSGDNINTIATKYSVPSQAIADFNYILDTSKLAVGTELVIPGAKIPEVVPVYVPPSAIGPANFGQASPSKGFCVWPTTVRIISQYFTWYHNGLDVATPWNSGMPPIFACTGGTVTRAGWDPWGLGLHVKIEHGDGYETIYGHMSKISVGYGQHVSRGQVLGLMGNTGHSTGPHVHFTVKYGGVPQNPLNYTQ